MTVSKRGKFYHYRFMVDGHPYAGSTKETNPGKAKSFEAKLITGIRERGVNPQVNKAPLLSEFAPRFLAHVKQITEAGQLKPGTRKCYTYGWRLLAESKMAGMRLDKITTSSAATLQFPGSASNGNMALRTLHRMLSLACDLGLLRTAPKIKLLEEVGREAIIEPWVEELLQEFAPPTLSLVIAIMLDCGMRPEEVREMRWEHINWDRNVLLVPRGKSAKARRYVGITDRMRDRLRIAQQGNATEWVFPAASKSGHAVNVTKAWGLTVKAVNAAIKERGLPELPDGLVLYSARHTFATNFLAGGGDLSKLMMLLGHASILTTQKYLHPSTAGAAEVMNVYNRKKAGPRLVKSA